MHPFDFDNLASISAEAHAHKMWINERVLRAGAEATTSNLRQAQAELQSRLISANCGMISAQSEAEALRRLNAAVMSELENPSAGRRLSDPKNDWEREEFVRKTTRISHAAIIERNRGLGADTEILDTAEREGPRHARLKPLPEIAEAEQRLRRRGRLSGLR